MKTVLRILAGLMGVVVIFLGIKQIVSGARQMTGKSVTQSQKPGETYTPAEGGYAHRIPEGWKAQSEAQQPSRMFVAPGNAGNMITGSQDFPGSLREYADANIREIQLSSSNVKILSDSEFLTAANATAFRIKFENKVKEMDIVQTMYVFEGQHGKRIIVTCTTTAKQAPEFEKLFDECMKTLTVAQP